MSKKRTKPTDLGACGKCGSGLVPGVTHICPPKRKPKKPTQPHAIMPIADTTPAVPFYLSKTLITNAIIAVGALIPAVREWVSANPETTLIVVSSVGAFLRFVTRGRIVFN